MPRFAKKINPQRASTFDQQFWPVIVALTVLCGIAIGAVVTLLNGPWMWGSLLVLPAFSAIAVYFLFHLDDTKLRRALQLSIIISLAVHLVVLVFASVVNIFQNPYRQPERKIAVRPERTILISDQSTQFVWEQPNLRETPEPEIETQRQQPTTTNVQPQPIPVEQSNPEYKPQIVKRETPSQTIPRLDRELSQLRRQTKNLQPKSSQAQTAQPTSNPVKTASESKTEPSSSSRADQVQRQTAAKPSPAAQAIEKASANPAEKRSTANLAASSPQRAAAAQRYVESAPQPSSSAARVTKSTPKLPVVQKKLPNPSQQTASTRQPANREPAPASTELSRRPVQSNRARPALNRQPKTELSAQSQLQRVTERRQSNNPQPTISNPVSNEPQPRRSAADATIAMSPIAVEKPARLPDSQSTTTELNSRTLSVSKSSEGVAGAGKSQNLERDRGGMTSPAVRASDSAKRKRTESRPTESRMLTTSQRATTKRSTGAARAPTSAFRADTTSMAKIAGSVKPTDQSLESSAANIDSASTDYRSEISAERGAASVDLGPTKVVADQESPRRSGGGQPEVAQLNPENTRRSRLYSDQQPTLVADAGSETVAQSSPNSVPQFSDLEPSNQATALSKSGGDSSMTVERDSAVNQGDATNQGESATATQIANAPQRAERESDAGSIFDQDDDEDDDEKLGNQRTRIAQAPVTRRDAGMGNSRSGTGTTVATSDRSADVPSESLATTLQRQASSVLPGSGMSRMGSNLMLQAATSLPVIQPSTTKRTTRDARGTDASGNSQGLPQVVSNTPTTKKSTAVPKLSSSADSALPKAMAEGRNETAKMVAESANVSIEKSETSRSDQGAAMEIDAIEGPAGLAERVSTNLGVMNRPASRDSEQIQPDLDNRFRSTVFGGSPAINPDAVMAKEAFRSRSPAAIAKSAEPTTEAAIQLGLEFLARYQSPDGSWSLSGFDQSHPQHVVQLNSDAAATGLALLAFQGAGYNHREFRYARQVNHGLQWLIENQRNDGCLYVESDERSNEACRMYSHGIAALALTEAYGMTQDAQIRVAAQKALDYITKSQDPLKGGWRYFENPADRSSDTSVTGWMMMALQSGKLAGLDADRETLDKIESWLDVASQPEDKSLYRYNPYAVDSDGISRLQGRQVSPSMTAVGLLMRIYGGWDRDDPRILDGATYLTQQQMPSDSTTRLRDTYYWYYATQVLKHIDGPLWDKWEAQLRPLLIRSQIKTGDLAGSWHPYEPIPDRWGSFGGRLYVTTMNLLSLEVRHRMLPLYKKTNRED